MSNVHTAGFLIIAGSIVFLVGAGIGVPRVWTEPNPQTRERMLSDNRSIWLVAQPLYGLGALAAAVGVGCLAIDTTPRALFAIAGAAMTVGALAWSWSLYLRGTRIADFVHGRQPGWPFRTYVLLTNTGLALLGVGLLLGDFPAWLAWLTLTADLMYLTIYLVFRDIPPFAFYLLLPVIGIVLL